MNYSSIFLICESCNDTNQINQQKRQRSWLRYLYHQPINSCLIKHDEGFFYKSSLDAYSCGLIDPPPTIDERRTEAYRWYSLKKEKSLYHPPPMRGGLHNPSTYKTVYITP